MTSPYTHGWYISTVAGRLRMILLSVVGSMTSITAAQISTANSGSVPVKLSGEYSYEIAVEPIVSSSLRQSLAALVAMSTMPWRSSPNTTRRCKTLVEL